MCVYYACGMWVHTHSFFSVSTHTFHIFAWVGSTQFAIDYYIESDFYNLMCTGWKRFAWNGDKAPHNVHINQFSQITQADPVCSSLILVSVYWLWWVLLLHEDLFERTDTYHIHAHMNIAQHLSVERKKSNSLSSGIIICSTQWCLLSVSAFSHVNYSKRCGITIMKWFSTQTVCSRNK